MKKIISIHWPAVILAFSVGIMVVLPTLLSIQQLGPGNFKGIYPLLSDDEDHYMTMIREVADGHVKMSNPYIKEYKEGPYIQPFLADLYYYGFANFFGISINLAALANDFILPAVSFLLLYILFFRISESKKTSLFFVSMFFLYFLELFNRPVNPQFSFVFLLLGLNLIWLIVNNKNQLRKILTYNFYFALVFGVLIYVYPFYWMTLGVVYFLLTIVNFYFDKDFKYLLSNWLSFGVPVIFLALPFLINFIELKKNSLFEETTIRNGYIFTHIPGAFLSLLPLFIPTILILYFYFFSNETNKGKSKMFYTLFGIAFVLAGFVLNWQNILTGLTIQFTSHLYPVMVLFSLLISMIVLVAFVEKDKVGMIGSEKIVYVLIGISMLGIMYLQKDQLFRSFENIRSPKNIASHQKIAEPIFWLNHNIKKDSTIYTLGEEYDWAIPIYTSGNVYFTKYAGIFLMSNAELEKRWVVKHFFDKVDQSAVYGNRNIWLDRFIDTYQSKEVRRRIIQFFTGKEYPETTLMSQGVVDDVLKIYGDFQKIGFEKSLKTYDADYVMFNYTDSKYSNLKTKFDNYDFLEKVYQDHSTMIYKVN